MSNLIFCLMGPTASGKTALALELVRHYPFEIISVDSAMIYRDMNVGTAKPFAHELEYAPHHLINIKDPIESYSAAEFCEDASALADQIRAKGRIPLLVGGTMMYFNSMQKGLAVLPKADEFLRTQLEEEAALHGWPALHHKLAQIDAPSAARIHPHDAQRIQRALEVYYQTGTNLSTLLAEQKSSISQEFINLILMPEKRADLHKLIASRFNQMLKEGLIEEVRFLQEKWQLDLNLPAMRSVGYRQVFEYLQGQMDYNLMCDKAIAATRQLAKRQLTWLRHWDQGFYYNSQSPSFRLEIMAKIKEILDNDEP